ncbi:MAG: HAMP domain-containing protein, partial [Candidatus Latescibacterota bacterium]
RLLVWAGLFSAGLVWYGFYNEGGWGWRIVLALPFLWSFRWRRDLGAGRLILAGLAGLVSMPLASLNMTIGGHALSSGWFGVVPGCGTFIRSVVPLVWVYGFLTIPATAGRAHLSIRRIGVRLIGSHLLAGVVPVLLAALFLLLSGALFLSTSRGSIGVHILRDMSEEARARLASAGRGEADALSPFGTDLPGQIVLQRRGDGPTEVLQGEPIFPSDSLLFRNEPSSETPLLWDGRTLFVRARLDAERGGEPLRLEALAPIDSLGMVRVSRIAGAPVRVNPSLVVGSEGGNVQIGPAEESEEGDADADSFRTDRGHPIGPAGGGARELPGGAIIPCLVWSDGAWSERTIAVTSSAPLGEQIFALFSIRDENPLATVVLVILGVILVLFFAALWVTGSMALGMGRSITRAVRALTDATHALGQGKLDHRIALEGEDELWNVASSFNAMAGDLEKTRARELETRRLEEELRLARVIQNRLLPAGPPSIQGLELAGVSIPAREVGGDYYDYLVLEGGLVGLALADVSGKGAPAALLMSSFRASLRSQDLARLGPAETLARVNRFIHESVDTGRFITAFLGLLDSATGELRYASAGHDPPILVHADGRTEELSGGGLVLGVLPEVAYEETTVRLDAGSLVTVFTDGVTEARRPDGEFFGVEGLVEALRALRGEPCAHILGRVAKIVQEFSAEAGQADDITLLMARLRP